MKIGGSDVELQSGMQSLSSVPKGENLLVRLVFFLYTLGVICPGPDPPPALMIWVLCCQIVVCVVSPIKSYAASLFLKILFGALEELLAGF
jgi:hypothetical protein